MNVANDALRPTPEQRAAHRIAANAAWLARAKERGHAPGGSYTKHPHIEELDRKMMKRSDEKALAEARKSLETERKAHKCYCCGRQNLPRYSRWLWSGGIGFLVVYWWTSHIPDVAALPGLIAFPYLAVLAIAAGVGSALHEAENLVE